MILESNVSPANIIIKGIVCLSQQLVGSLTSELCKNRVPALIPLINKIIEIANSTSSSKKGNLEKKKKPTQFSNFKEKVENLENNEEVIRHCIK